MKKLKNKRIVFLGIGLVIISVVIIMMVFKYPTTEGSVQSVSLQNVELKQFSAEELSKYNGTNPDLPIYLAFEGKVYAVTAGKKYYEKGGSYHFLVSIYSF